MSQDRSTARVPSGLSGRRSLVSFCGYRLVMQMSRREETGGLTDRNKSDWPVDELFLLAVSAMSRMFKEKRVNYVEIEIVRA